MAELPSGNRVRIARLILIPSVITLVVTLLRVVGELRHWSPALFNPSRRRRRCPRRHHLAGAYLRNLFRTQVVRCWRRTGRGWESHWTGCSRARRAGRRFHFNNRSPDPSSGESRSSGSC